MSKVKIGIDIRNIGKNRTGDEVVFFNLVKSLSRKIQINQDHVTQRNTNLNEYVNKTKEVKFLLFTDITDKNKINEIKRNLEIKNDNRFEIISLKSINKFIWNFWTLPKYLKKNSVDVYHTQYIVPWFVPKRTKIVTTIHDVSFLRFSRFINKVDLIFLKVLIPMSIKRANRVITVSDFSKRELEKYYKVNAEKISVVYNAVGDIFYQEFSKEDLEETKKKYKLPKKFILYVGTLQPRKNIPNLIEAFYNIKNKLPETRLVLVGNKKSHNYDSGIDKTIEAKKMEKEVIFPGYIDQDDLPKVYKLANLFTFPSLYEGFGIPILEAMSQNVPVTSSDIESLQEVGQDAVMYFDPENLEDISDKLYTCSVELPKREDLINSGKNRLNDFSWIKSAEQTLSIYNDLIK